MKRLFSIFFKGRQDEVEEKRRTHPDDWWHPPQRVFGLSCVALLWVASLLFPSVFLCLLKILLSDCLFFRSYFNYYISLFPLFPSNLSIRPPLLSLEFMAPFPLISVAGIYGFVYTFVFLNITYWVCIVLLVLYFEDWPFATEQPVGGLSPGEDHLSCIKLYSLACRS